MAEKAEPKLFSLEYFDFQITGLSQMIRDNQVALSVLEQQRSALLLSLESQAAPATESAPEEG